MCLFMVVFVLIILNLFWRTSGIIVGFLLLRLEFEIGGSWAFDRMMTVHWATSYGSLIVGLFGFCFHCLLGVNWLNIIMWTCRTCFLVWLFKRRDMRRLSVIMIALFKAQFPEALLSIWYVVLRRKHPARAVVKSLAQFRHWFEVKTAFLIIEYNLAFELGWLFLVLKFTGGLHVWIQIGYLNCLGKRVILCSDVCRLGIMRTRIWLLAATCLV